MKSFKTKELVRSSNFSPYKVILSALITCNKKSYQNSTESIFFGKVLLLIHSLQAVMLCVHLLNPHFLESDKLGGLIIFVVNFFGVPNISTSLGVEIVYVSYVFGALILGVAFAILLYIFLHYNSKKDYTWLIAPTPSFREVFNQILFTPCVDSAFSLIFAEYAGYTDPFYFRFGVALIILLLLETVFFNLLKYEPNVNPRKIFVRSKDNYFLFCLALRTCVVGFNHIHLAPNTYEVSMYINILCTCIQIYEYYRSLSFYEEELSTFYFGCLGFQLMGNIILFIFVNKMIPGGSGIFMLGCAVVIKFFLAVREKYIQYLAANLELREENSKKKTNNLSMDIVRSYLIRLYFLWYHQKQNKRAALEIFQVLANARQCGKIADLEPEVPKNAEFYGLDRFHFVENQKKSLVTYIMDVYERKLASQKHKEVTQYVTMINFYKDTQNNFMKAFLGVMRAKRVEFAVNKALASIVLCEIEKDIQHDFVRRENYSETIVLQSLEKVFKFYDELATVKADLFHYVNETVDYLSMINGDCLVVRDVRKKALKLHTQAGKIESVLETLRADFPNHLELSEIYGFFHTEITQSRKKMFVNMAVLANNGDDQPFERRLDPSQLYNQFNTTKDFAGLVISMDPKSIGKVLMASQSVKNLFGFNVAHLNDIIPKEFHESHKEHLFASFERGEISDQHKGEILFALDKNNGAIACNIKMRLELVQETLAIGAVIYKEILHPKSFILVSAEGYVKYFSSYLISALFGDEPSLMTKFEGIKITSLMPSLTASVPFTRDGVESQNEEKHGVFTIGESKWSTHLSLGSLTRKRSFEARFSLRIASSEDPLLIEIYFTYFNADFQALPTDRYKSINSTPYQSEIEARSFDSASVDNRPATRSKAITSLQSLFARNNGKKNKRKLLFSKSEIGFGETKTRKDLQESKPMPISEVYGEFTNFFSSEFGQERDSLTQQGLRGDQNDSLADQSIVIPDESLEEQIPVFKIENPKGNSQKFKSVVQKISGVKRLGKLPKKDGGVLKPHDFRDMRNALDIRSTSASSRATSGSQSRKLKSFLNWQAVPKYMLYFNIATVFMILTLMATLIVNYMVLRDVTDRMLIESKALGFPLNLLLGTTLGYLANQIFSLQSQGVTLDSSMPNLTDYFTNEALTVYQLSYEKYILNSQGLRELPNPANDSLMMTLKDHLLASLEHNATYFESSNLMRNVLYDISLGNYSSSYSLHTNYFAFFEIYGELDAHYTAITQNTQSSMQRISLITAGLALLAAIIYAVIFMKMFLKQTKLSNTIFFAIMRISPESITQFISDFSSKAIALEKSLIAENEVNEQHDNQENAKSLVHLHTFGAEKPQKTLKTQEKSTRRKIFRKDKATWSGIVVILLMLVMIFTYYVVFNTYIHHEIKAYDLLQSNLFTSNSIPLAVLSTIAGNTQKIACSYHETCNSSRLTQELSAYQQYLTTQSTYFKYYADTLSAQSGKDYLFAEYESSLVSIIQGNLCDLNATFGEQNLTDICSNQFISSAASQGLRNLFERIFGMLNQQSQFLNSTILTPETLASYVLTDDFTELLQVQQIFLPVVNEIEVQQKENLQQFFQSQNSAAVVFFVVGLAFFTVLSLAVVAFSVVKVKRGHQNLKLIVSLIPIKVIQENQYLFLSLKKWMMEEIKY